MGAKIISKSPSFDGEEVSMLNRRSLLSCILRGSCAWHPRCYEITKKDGYRLHVRPRDGSKSVL